MATFINARQQVTALEPRLNLYGLNVPGHQSIDRCIRDVAESVKQDLANDYRYHGDGLAPGELVDRAAARLFEDCGLPRVKTFPAFAHDYVNEWMTSPVLGSVGLSGTAVERVLSSDEVVVKPRIFPGFLRQVLYLFSRRALLDRRVLEHEPKFVNLLGFLTKLDWRESDEWTASSAGWQGLHSLPLIQYYVDFFSGRFIDRSGVSISTSLDLNSIKLDQLEVSPKLAGQIISIAVEFLFDRKFGVPIYAPKILQTYRDYRSALSSQGDLQQQLTNLETSLTLEDWTPLVAGAPLYRGNVRRGVLALQALDHALTTAGQNSDSLKEEITKIESANSDLQLVITCFKTGVIEEYLHCVFLNGGGVCDKDADIGKTKNDYADLLGRLVAYAGSNAEKQTRAAVGALIRGLSIASLNNEVLSELIAGAIATLAKKVAETVTYRFMHRFITDPNVMPGNAAGKKSILDFLEAMHVAGKFRSGDNPFEISPIVERHLGFVPEPGEASLTERENIARDTLIARKHFQADRQVPERFDLRNVQGKSFVTGVRNQGTCGSCVAFGVVATGESRWAIVNGGTLLPDGREIDLSEAHLFYCYGQDAGRRCANGWWPRAALAAFRDHGLVDEGCFPYTSGNQPCRLCPDHANRRSRITGFSRLTDPMDMKDWLVNRGALTACFSVYANFKPYFSANPTGVYRQASGRLRGGHCVCCIGYDDSLQCWICKNSWGPIFGDAGYFRIGYGVVGIDAEMYGIDDFA